MLHPKTTQVIKIPFEIILPDYILVPEEITLKANKALPERILLKEGFALPEIDLNEEDIPLRSILALENANIAESVAVRIFPQLVGNGDQYVKFAVNDDCHLSKLVAHCWLKTNIIANGPCEDWKFQDNRLLVSKSLYWEYIQPYYLIDFWHGLAVHLEYLNPDNWWATF